MANTYTTLFTDNFHRPDEMPLDPANWTNVPNPTLPTSELGVVSNVCVANSDPAADDGYEIVTSVVPPNDQFAEVTIGAYSNPSSNSGSSALAWVRGNISSFTDGYGSVLSGNGDGTSGFGIAKGNTFLASTTISTVNTGDVVRIEAVGSTLTALYNGVILLTAIDSTFASGTFGTELTWDVVQTDTTITKFVGGSITSSFTPSKDNKVTSIFTIQKATLISNIAYFQVDACPALEIGGSVVVAGCTTSTFNTTLTVLTCGTFIIPNAIADTKGGVQLWTGFSAALVHANIGIEIEPTLPTDGAEGSPAGTATGTVTQ